MTSAAPRSLLQAVPLAVARYAARQGHTDDRLGRCADDVEEFARHVWIQDPNRGDMPFVPWEWQPGLLSLWQRERKVCVLKARQLGVSWLVAIYVLWVAMFNPAARVVLISKKQGDADKLLAKVKFVLRNLPPWLKPVYTDNASTVRFPLIDAELESHPSSGDAGRSVTATVVVLDEHAHQMNAESIWVAVKPTAEYGQVLSISTANGLGALHTRLYKSAKDGSNGFVPVFIPWSAHPERDEEWRDKERRDFASTVQPQLFAQEYPDNDEEAFVQSGNPVFTEGEITRQPIEHIDPAEPGLWLYRPPVPKVPYVIGADPAEGVTGGSWCSAVVWSVTKDEAGYHGEQVAQLRGYWSPEDFAKRLDRLARHYAQHFEQRRQVPVLMGVERNNHGHAVLLRLRQLNTTDKPYALAYWQKKLGWVTTNATRPLMLDEFAGAIRDGQLVVHDPVTQSQMGTFAHGGKAGGQAQQGYHDDDMLAAAIGWQHHRRAFGVVLDVPEGRAT